MQRCPVSLLPGHVLAARGPCMSSNGLPQHRSCLPKPDLHVPMTHPDRTLNPATCLMPRAMFPEPVLGTSIQALRTWKSTTLHGSDACPMHTLDLPGSPPAALPNGPSADQYDSKPIVKTSFPDRTTAFLLTALSEP